MPRAESVRLPGPWRLKLRASARSGILCGNRGPAEPTGQRGMAAIAPWSLPWKTGEDCSVCPSSLPLAGPCPSCHPLRHAEMPTGTQGEQVQQPGLLAFLGQDRRCHSTPVLRAELDGRAGASHRGAEREGAGRTARRGWVEDEDVHARSAQALGGHRFWQHCSLLGFCPSVVGGTLMSTTLFPGDSSCAARSAICFCDTMR